MPPRQLISASTAGPLRHIILLPDSPCSGRIVHSDGTRRRGSDASGNYPTSSMWRHGWSYSRVFLWEGYVPCPGGSLGSRQEERGTVRQASQEKPQRARRNDRRGSPGFPAGDLRRPSGRRLRSVPSFARMVGCKLASSLINVMVLDKIVARGKEGLQRACKASKGRKRADLRRGKTGERPKPPEEAWASGHSSCSSPSRSGSLGISSRS